LNAKTLNRKSVSAMCDKCVLIDKHDMCVHNSVAKPLKKTVASESNKKPRNNVRKLYERFGKIYKWSYIKFTPSGYMCKPKKSTCFIRDLKGNDLLTGSRGTDLYSITLQGTNSPNPICLMAKATSSQAWLWHRRLSHLNFDTINLLSKNDIVKGYNTKRPLLEHLNKTALSKDGITLYAYFAAEGIQLQKSVARTPKQNGVVERRNRALVEAARTMLSAAK
nr:integrase, catalytic region, zinc finger, CCHC-type, peptidase aspartic, catalytic [Tanacetum cinerariifolium]